MDLPTTILTSFATSVATNGAKAPLHSLDNLWYMTFGHKVEYLAEIKRAKNEVNISQYKESISKKVDAIPEENLQEPPMSIVGPALEASKYYIEEEELREMFAKVIAASMDSSKTDYVHHSFVEIIKQLSPRDADNISIYKRVENYPIALYRARKVSGESYAILDPIVFSPNKDGSIDKRDFSSITNLIRLGLLTSNFTTHIYSDPFYSLYEKTSLYQYYAKNIDPKTDTLVCEKGVLSITPLGKEFIKVCL